MSIAFFLFRVSGLLAYCGDSFVFIFGFMYEQEKLNQSAKRSR